MSSMRVCASAYVSAARLRMTLFVNLRAKGTHAQHCCKLK